MGARAQEDAPLTTNCPELLEQAPSGVAHGARAPWACHWAALQKSGRVLPAGRVVLVAQQDRQNGVSAALCLVCDDEIQQCLEKWPCASPRHGDRPAEAEQLRNHRFHGCLPWLLGLLLQRHSWLIALHLLLLPAALLLVAVLEVVWGRAAAERLRSHRLHGCSPALHSRWKLLSHRLHGCHRPHP